MLGFAIVLAAWHLVTAILEVPMFKKIPPPAVVLREWFTPDPFFGVSVYTPLY